MADANIVTFEADSVSTRKAKLLWPTLATMMAFPVIATMVSMFLLWTVHSWNVPPWALLLSAIPLIVIGTYAVWRSMRSWAERRIHFSLRGMLLGVAAIALTLGTVGQSLFQRLRQGQAIINVTESGGFPGHWANKKDNWLEARIGYDPFDEVRVIRVNTDQAIPALLKHSDPFTDLEQLSFGKGPTDASLKCAAEFNAFPKLYLGEFVCMQLTDNGMRHLKEWTRVRELFFNGCAFTDKGLMHLKSLPKLESLTLIGDECGSMSITDKGLTYIGNMSYLKKLWIIGIPITDAGLAKLQSLTDLKILHIRRTKITEKGFLNFCKALPNCWTSISEYASFPNAAQIQRISVWNDCPEKKRLVTIVDPVQIAAIMKWLERYVDQRKTGWEHEWNHDSNDSISIEIEGPNRCLCRIQWGDGFFQGPWGSYCPMSSSEGDKLRGILGLDAVE